MSQAYGPAALAVSLMSPLRVALLSPSHFILFLKQTGLGLDDFSIDEEAFAAFENLLSIADALESMVSLLDTWDDETGLEADTVNEILTIAFDVYVAINGLSDLSESDLVDLPEQLSDPEFWIDLALLIPNFLVVNFLQREFPVVFVLMRGLGLIYRDSTLGNLAVSWTDLPRFFTEPEQLFIDKYGSGKDFNAPALLKTLAALLQALSLDATISGIRSSLREAHYAGSAPPVNARELTLNVLQNADETGLITEAGLLLLPLPADPEHTDGSSGYDLGLMPYVEGGTSASVDLNKEGNFQARFEVSGDLAGGIIFSIDETGLVKRDAGVESTAFEGNLSFELVYSPREDSERLLLFGNPGTVELTAARAVAGIGAQSDDFYIAAGVEDLKLTIDVGEDALLSKLIEGPIEVDGGDLVAGWRSSRGLYFEQGAGFSVVVPLSIEWGPARLHELGFSLNFDPNIQACAWLDGDLTVGPLFLGVEGLGITVDVITTDEGQFGDFDLDVALKSPNGYIAALESDIISGGGALIKEAYDYKGALSLRLQSFGLSAFGILSTRLPSGEEGFSFLASLFGEFNIALGYGFFLTGLGGIIGINRTSDVEALRSILSEGRLDSVLFPSNPISDATIILEDLGTAFPAHEGQHLFGPMGRIAWGVPALIEGKIGLILEVGSATRLLILGSVGAFLPSRSTSIIALNVDFLGSIDFNTGEIGFDAAITQSKILTWPISGEAAVRTGWGSHAGLVAAIGGLHPQYPNPTGFPSLERLTINFGNTNPRLTLTAYHAVTTNSVQLGASASLYVDGGKILTKKIEVEGWASFNALIIFNPFYFQTDLSIGLELLIDGTVVCGIGGDVSLSGPNRFEIEGRVWVTVMGFDIDIPIRCTWGSAVTDQSANESALSVLEQGLEQAEHFEPVPSTTRSTGVTFMSNTTGETLIDPTGGVQLIQKAIPLDVTIEKLGNAKLANGIDKVDIDVVYPDGTTAMFDQAKTEFVHSHFFHTNDQEKLRTPAFDEYTAGFALSDDNGFVYEESAKDTIINEYEVKYIEDGQQYRFHKSAVLLSASDLDRLHRITMASLRTTSVSGLGALAIGASAVTTDASVTASSPSDGPSNRPFTGKRKLKKKMTRFGHRPLSKLPITEVSKSVQSQSALMQSRISGSNQQAIASYIADSVFSK